MKGKYLLVIACMLVSLTSMAQRRKRSSPPPEETTETRAKAADPKAAATAAQDTNRHVEDDVIPESTDFICSSLLTLMNDAANDFEHTKGKSIETVAAGTRWTAMGGVPGAITSSLLRAPARWQYEGIMYQGNSKDDMKEMYEKYKGILSSCLSAKGYTAGSGKNASSKLSDTPELKYTKSAADAKDAKHNPRATINVDYTAGADLYVVTVNVWSN